MTDHKSPIDLLLDVVVYAPIGLFMNLDEVLPELIRKGHQQVATARIFGQFAVKTGSQEAKKRFDGLAGQVAGANGAPGDARGASSAASPSAGPASAASSAAASSAAAASPSAPPLRAVVTDHEPSAADEAPPPSADALGITDYDVLSASQVVPRLAGLASDDLEAVRRYETANRARKTILAKIAQLQG